MHSMKKLILSVLIFTFGFATATHASANLHLNFPFENIDNRMRIMPVDRVDGPWGVIDSNGFNLFTRCFQPLFPKESIHLLGKPAKVGGFCLKNEGAPTLTHVH